MRIATLFIAACLASLSGCAVNPVTGKTELSLVSENWEIQVGENNYAPSRQSQGGDYLLDPELTSYVKGVGQRLAAVSDRPLPYDFEIINSSVPNAWALPGGKIAINRGLLTELGSEAELAAVLGHEIVHSAARHGAKGYQRGMLLQGAVMAAALSSRDSKYGQFAVLGASVAAQLINQKYGRSAELESDLYGTRYMSEAGYDPDAAVDLQETFVRLSGGRNPGFLEGLFASHPPSMERVEKNRETAASLPDGGEIGRERYQQKMATLIKQKPAYEAYDKGRKALSEDKAEEAESLAKEAIKLEPRESYFYGLLGDIDMSEKRYAKAVDHFSDAQARNDQFFYYPLQRGIARKELGLLDTAEADLQASINLLPTGNAFMALGEIAESQGDINKAKDYYAKAGGSGGAAGQAAQDALVRLDLPTAPGKYLRLADGLDADGQVIVELANPTRQTVGNIQLVIDYLDNRGRARQLVRPLRGSLPPGKAQRIEIGLGPFQTREAYRVRIASANVISNP